MRGFLVRGGAVWQLVGLITRRSQVQILPPLPISLVSISARSRAQSRACNSHRDGTTCLPIGKRAAELLLPMAVGPILATLRARERPRMDRVKNHGTQTRNDD